MSRDRSRTRPGSRLTSRAQISERYTQTLEEQTRIVQEQLDRGGKGDQQVEVIAVELPGQESDRRPDAHPVAGQNKIPTAKAIRLRLPAFRISSTPISTLMAFRRVDTARMPNENSSAATMSLYLLLPRG